MDAYVKEIDNHLERFFADWNAVTTAIVLILLALAVYPIFFTPEPDTYPGLLFRQANVGNVRQEGESAVYRSLETPIGYTLRTGLNVKLPGTSQWSGGKDGDIRDIWRKAVAGVLDEKSRAIGQQGKILTIHGREEVEAHDWSTLSREINVIGKHLKETGTGAVAIYLPNSTELLTAIFAAAFYGLHPILLPYDQPPEVILKLLPMTDATSLIAAAGSLSLDDLRKTYPKIKETVLVVEKTSRQMDWSEEGASTWHELVDAASNVTAEFPDDSSVESVPDLITIWMHDNAATGEIVAFSQKNIVSAVSAQLTALPNKQRVGNSDLFLPADSFTTPYVLIQTFAALYSSASIAINSVAGPEVEISIAAQGVAPTIIAASPSSIAKLHTSSKSRITSTAKKYALHLQNQALAAGYMPRRTVISQLNAPVTASIGAVTGKLRLIYTYEGINSGSPPLTSVELSDIRALTGARVIYALTAAKVAGAIAQTGFYDYRVTEQRSGKHSHFGAPLSSVEIKLVDTDTYQTVDDKVQGQITVSGPSVLGGTVNLGIPGEIREDGTLAYI